MRKRNTKICKTSIFYLIYRGNDHEFGAKDPLLQVWFTFF